MPNKVAAAFADPPPIPLPTGTFFSTYISPPKSQLNFFDSTS